MGNGFLGSTETRRFRPAGSSGFMVITMSECCGERKNEDAQTLFPQSEMAQDALDGRLVVDESDDPYFAETFQADPSSSCRAGSREKIGKIGEQKHWTEILAPWGFDFFGYGE